MTQRTQLSTIATPTQPFGDFSGKESAVAAGRLVAVDVRIENGYRATPSIVATYAATNVKIESSYRATSVSL